MQLEHAGLVLQNPFFWAAIYSLHAIFSFHANSTYRNLIHLVLSHPDLKQCLKSTDSITIDVLIHNQLQALASNHAHYYTHA